MSSNPLKFYNRPSFKEHLNFINNLSFDFITSPILKTISLYFEKKQKAKEINDFYVKFGLIKNLKDKKYGIRIGYAVKNLSKEKEIKLSNKKEVFATQYDSFPFNVISPILIDDDTLRRHIQIIGASGSGKTVLIKSLFFQNALRGGGNFLVLGKGDNTMLQEFYTLACMAKRERDLIVFDFVNGNAPSAKSYQNKILNNAMSFFDLGGILELEQMIVALAKLDNPDDWGQKTVDLITASVSALYKLFESKLFFDVEKIDEIVKSKDTLKTIRKNLCEPTGYQMLEYMTNYKNIFKLWVIIEKLYLENPNFNDLIYEKTELQNNLNYEDRIRLSERDKISFHLKKMKDTVADRIDTQKMFNYILNNPKNAFDKLIEESSESQSPLYAIGIAISKFGTLINFFKRFELILNNSMSDINILTAFRMNKLIILNIPGQDQQIAPLIGKMVAQILKKVNERYSTLVNPLETFIVFLDEINSWAKGGEGETLGIGDIMSVLRGAGIGCVVAHQTSLISMDSGKGIEQDQVEGNRDIICLLKTGSPKIVKELNELYEKEIKFVFKESGENHLSKSAKNYGIDLETREFDAFSINELQAFNPGQGYFIKNGQKQKFVVEMIDSDKFSKKDPSIVKDIRVPIQKKVSKEYFLNNFEEVKAKSLKAENLDFSTLKTPNKPIKIKQTALTKQGSKFEQLLIKSYKKDGWDVIDGTGDNFADFDAEGIDIIIKKENKVILVQAKNWFKKELGRDEAVLIISKMENFYRQKYFNDKEIICEGLLAINEEINMTAPALKYLQDKDKDPIFRVETKKYKFD